MGAMQATAAEAVQKGIDLAVEQINKSPLKATAEDVRASAQALINYTEELRIKNNTVVNQVQTMDSNTDIETVYAFSKKMVKTKQEFLELMKRVYDFQNKANALLGQQVQMVFIDFTSKGKAILYSMENSIADLSIDRTSSKRGGLISGRYRKSVISKMGSVLTNSNLKEENTHLEGTFEEVYTRYKISKQRMKMRGAAYILWKEGDWDGVWISGAGPLGEAYFNFFINEYIFSSATEPAVRDFMTNNQYGAVKADNASGFLQGDVSKNGMEYGIKINAAQSLGYMDIIEYAKEVLKQADINKYLLNLKQELEQKASANMVRQLDKNLEEVTDQLIADIQARINKA